MTRPREWWVMVGLDVAWKCATRRAARVFAGIERAKRRPDEWARVVGPIR